MFFLRLGEIVLNEEKSLEREILKRKFFNMEIFQTIDKYHEKYNLRYERTLSSLTWWVGI